MKLHACNRMPSVAESFVRSVVEVRHRRFELGRERGGVDRITVIVRSNEDFAGDQILHRLIAAAMAVGKLIGSPPQASASS